MIAIIIGNGLIMCGKKSSAKANDSGDPRKKYGVSLKVFVLLGLYKMIQMLFKGTIWMMTYKHKSCILVRNRQNPQTTKRIKSYYLVLTK